MSMTKVGDKCWIWDINSRTYRVEGERRTMTARGHFREAVIEGETRQSWIAGGGKKFDKETGRWRDKNYAGHFRIFLTEKSVDDWCFIEEFRSKIARAAQDCWDADTLRRVAAVLGVVVKEAGNG